MSEYQYYEFRAVDRPLSAREIAEVRPLSTRATITATSFVNVYNWGDFRGSPDALMDRYYDAFLYDSNFGVRKIELRLPRRFLSLETANPYCFADAASVRPSGDENVVLEFVLSDEGGEYFEEVGEEGLLSSILPVRADLLNGDLRCLYLGWLLCLASGELADDEPEPAVPPGLGTLTPSLKAFADFFYIDADLIAEAATRSTPIREVQPGDSVLAAWMLTLPTREKDDLLVRFLKAEEPLLRTELLWRFRRSRPGPTAGLSIQAAEPRTVTELLAAAEIRTEQRLREEAEREARALAERERQAAIDRARHLNRLAGHEGELWPKIEPLIEARKAAEYEQAVQLLVDLRDLAARTGDTASFRARVAELKARHPRKTGFLQRLRDAGL